MRRPLWLGPSIAGALALTLTLATACGGKVFVDPPGQGGGGAGGSSSSSSSSSSTSSSAVTSGGCGGPSSSGFFPCSPGPTCEATSSCLALADNLGPLASFRISHLDFKSPSVFTSGVVGSVIESAIAPSIPSCGLFNGGTFNWLLRFDTGTGTFLTGGAKPVANPAVGYSFMTDIFQTFSTSPMMASLLGNGCGPFSTTPVPLLTVPMFLDPGASQVLPMPLRQLRFSGVTLSEDRDCIGVHNAAGLSPQNNCLPDDAHPLFLDGGSLHAFFSLEDADAVTIAALSQSLCVLLTGDPAAFGDGGSPIQKCKRDPQGKIIFLGDWCSMDTPATPSCQDSVLVEGTFAASAVTILN